jgi:hypothetical protein
MSSPTTAIPGRQAMLFVSHATADGAVLTWVTAQIEAMGIHPYLAEHDPQPGRNLGDKVIAAINDSDAMLVLLTRQGFESTFVQQEIGAARHAGKPILALVDQAILDRNRAMLDGAEVIVVNTGDLAQSSATLVAVLRELSAQRGMAPPPAELTTRPGLQVELGVRLELTANDVLLGLLLVTACAGIVYLATREGGAPLAPPTP